MRQAGYFVLISAVFHLVGLTLAGFNQAALLLLGPAFVYVLLYAGLARGMMWVAWLALIMMFVGAAGALSEFFGASPVPTWVFAAILTADVIAALLLIGAIWRGRHPAALP